MLRIVLLLLTTSAGCRTGRDSSVGILMKGLPSFLLRIWSSRSMQYRFLFLFHIRFCVTRHSFLHYSLLIINTTILNFSRSHLLLSVPNFPHSSLLCTPHPFRPRTVSGHTFEYQKETFYELRIGFVIASLGNSVVKEWVQGS